ncbi:MAG: glycosyltransferase family 9 protein [bacterium]|nr:glycosyltransferase family 9 protein [bacterium]
MKITSYEPFMRQKLNSLYLFLRGKILNTLSIFLTKQSKAPHPNEIKRILLIRIDRIGDVVLSTPALRALRERFPISHISILVSPKTQDLLLQSPYVDEVIPYNGKIAITSLLHSKNRRKKFNLAIDLHLDYPLKTALIAYLSGAKYRVGFNIAGKSIFLNIRVMPDKKEKHLVEHTLDLIRAVSGNISTEEPELSIIPEAKQYVNNFLIHNNILNNDLLVGIHPGGYYPTQRWLPERFARVGDKIIDEYKAKIILMGGPGEEEIVEEIASNMKHKPVIYVREPLRNLVAIIDRCSLLICNNSGPLHIATAIGTPTVSTMGPTNPVRWWPWGDRNIVIRKHLPCNPCNKGVCNDHKCMELITVNEVMEAVNTILTRKRE